MAGRWSTVLRGARGAGKMGKSALQAYLASRASRGAGYGASAAAAGGMGGPRRKSRGITAADFKTTHRTMRKIIKLYNKLPKRPASKFGGFKGGRFGK